MPQTRRFAALPGKDITPGNTDDKYVTFRRQELVDVVRAVLNRPATLPQSTLMQELMEIALEDAVVIRRQDLFASPALNTYASCIAIVCNALPNGKQRTELMKIADYFHTQSVLAGEEGFKLPDV